jgi:stage II sporulation protein AA (anti-sigma F factor antagonist)
MTDDVPYQQPSRATPAIAAGSLWLRSRREGAAHVIGLEGELDLAAAETVERELARVEASDAATITIDLSQLTFMDSTGVRILLKAESRSRALASRLTLVRAPAGIQRVFAMCGVEHLLPFAD